MFASPHNFSQELQVVFCWVLWLLGKVWDGERIDSPNNYHILQSIWGQVRWHIHFAFHHIWACPRQKSICGEEQNKWPELRCFYSVSSRSYSYNTNSGMIAKHTLHWRVLLPYIDGVGEVVWWWCSSVDLWAIDWGSCILARYEHGILNSFNIDFKIMHAGDFTAWSASNIAGAQEHAISYTAAKSTPPCVFRKVDLLIVSCSTS